jgi:O-antigen ligase
MAPTGQYYKIMFGDVAMLHAMFIMLLLIYLDVTRIKKTLLAVSMGCTLYVSFLTEARGAWIILPVCIVPMIYYFLRFEKKKHGPGILLLVLLTIIFSVALNRDTVIERYDSAVSEIANYYSGENPYTSSDVRLLIWDSAIDVWSDVPLIGTGLGDFDEDFKKLKNIRKLKDRGLYKARQIHGNTHNMYIQSLVSTGVIGLICIVLALVILPFYFFIGLSQKPDGLVKLVGIVLVLSFAIFGLTESWTLRAPFLSIYLSYFVAIMSGVSTEQTISGMPSR